MLFHNGRVEEQTFGYSNVIKKRDVFNQPGPMPLPMVVKSRPYHKLKSPVFPYGPKAVRA